MKDIYQSVTNRIISELEQGVVPWIKPWSGETDPLPRNLHSKRHYRGINHLVLPTSTLCAQNRAIFDSSRY